MFVVFFRPPAGDPPIEVVDHPVLGGGQALTGGVETYELGGEPTAYRRLG